MRKRLWCTLVFLAALIFNCAGVGADWAGTTYEVFVYSFCDGNGDGIGDLSGLAGKLDYIADGGSGGLGCDAVWVTPVFPSPTYHKYDVTDYFAVDPDFGTMDDFDSLIRECHARGVRLLLDLPVNHTSSEHPWFLAAAEYLRELPEGEEPSAADCPYVEYYHFSKEAKSGYAALPGTAWYYEAQFWEGMPDLNLDSGAVRGEIGAIMRFWLERGVDGFRLDAVTSYYTGDQAANLAFLTWLNAEAETIWEDVRGTLAETIREDVRGTLAEAIWEDVRSTGAEAIWEDVRSTLAETAGRAGGNPDSGEAPAAGADDALADGVYLVGEAWTDQNSYAEFYASGIDSLFDFAFAGQDGIIANVVRGSRSAQSFVDAMIAEEELYHSYNPRAVNAPFYTNHDMARSTGYYAYDDGTRTKLAEGLNLLMTGNAFLYYGEEIGMKGSGKDENKRAPMYWTDDAGDGGGDAAPETDSLDSAGDDASCGGGNAAPETTAVHLDGMCDGPPDMDSFAMKFGSAAEQMEDPASIYRYVREAVRIRREFPVIARGRTAAVNSDAGDNRNLASFFRVDEAGGESVLIVLNTGEEEASFELRGEAAGYGTVAAELETGAETASVDGTALTLPAFGIAVLTAE